MLQVRTNIGNRTGDRDVFPAERLYGVELAYREFGSIEAIKELVKLGLGVSILAPWTCRKELEEGSLATLPLGRRKLKRQWGILHWRGRRFSLAEETFIGLCVEVAAGFK